MKIRQGKDIILRWKITTNGEALPLEGRNLTLILSTPNGRERVLSYTTEGDIIITRLFGKEITHLGDYTLTLWENRGEQGQTAVDAVNAFELVKYTTMEEDGSPCGNLEAEVLSLSGDLGVFLQGTTTEKNEQVDRNTEDIAELQQEMEDVKDDIHALGNSLDKLGKDNNLVQAEISNIQDKDAEQDKEIDSLLDILEGKMNIKDLGSGLRPDQAVSEIIQYVRSNEIKSALVFKYIDTDNSSTFGICISRTGTSGWIIYLVARKGLEVLKFNSRGSRETWNEYGGVLRHDMNSVADEQLECLSIKGIKSVLATKQDALISGQNIKAINGQSILGSGNIKIEGGITEEEKAEINAKIEGKAGIADVEELAQELATKAPKSGYAPDLKVNFAKELVGRGEATEEVIGSIRPTGVRSIGDGNATIERINGKSVVWNQFAPVISPSTIVPISNKVAQYTYDKDKVTITTTQELSNDYSAAVRITSLPHIAKHKYLIQFCAEAQNVNVYVKAITKKNVNGKQNIAAIYKASTDDNAYEPYIAISSGAAIGSTLEISNISWYDLTLMFNAGNEPKTIEEFEARKPLNVTNEYNEGTIVSYNGDALKSVGFNAWDEEWEAGTINAASGSNSPSDLSLRSKNFIPIIGGEEYKYVAPYSSYPNRQSLIFVYDNNKRFIKTYSNIMNESVITIPTEACYCKIVYKYYIQDYGTYKNDICLHLNHTYTPERYPNGYAPYEEDVHVLPNVTSILDADGNQLFPYGLLSAGSVHDEITATKAIKRVGVVDMGTLDWNVTSEYSYLPSSAYGDLISNNMLSIYDIVYSSDSNLPTRNDKYIQCFSPSVFRLRNVGGYNASQIKELLQGVLLYYELAEPIEVDLPEPLNMTYEAWDFGTEELIHEGATTPLNADIVYQFNAVDRIRENSSAIDVLEEHVEERKDDGIELLTNGNLKLTLKGETREFMPATPSGDPMHYAYVSAGAEYNDTNDYILKDAPWKDMVDTIEDKAKWGLDVVDASKVKQMTIKGVEYNYATENRTSPEGGTYDRYFLVGQSNGVWVEDETKVLHLPKCWYLNGLGDITDAEMRSIYAVKHMSYAPGGGFAGTPCRTFIDKVKYTGSDLTYGERYHRCKKVESIYSNVHRVANAGFNYAITSTTALRYFLPAVTLVSHINKIYGTFGDASLRVLSIADVQTAIQFPSKYISKASILYAINKVAPTLASAITITLHHDAYERLKGDADILQALETKNADLANTGDGKGKVSLVCATDNDTIPSE